MSNQHPQNLQEMLRQQTEQLRKNWMWFFVIGILMCVCGIFALTHLLFSSVASLYLLSIALFAGGFLMLMTAMQVRKIPKLFWTYLLSGILFLLACWFVLDQPAIALMTITILAAISLGASGILRVISGVQAMGLPGSAWLMISGVIGILAAVLIAVDLRGWSVFLPGMLLALDILFSGIGLLLLGLSLKK